MSSVRACYTCEHVDICVLYHHVNKAIGDGFRMLGGSAHNEVLEAVGLQCLRFTAVADAGEIEGRPEDEGSTPKRPCVDFAVERYHHDAACGTMWRVVTPSGTVLAKALSCKGEALAVAKALRNFNR